jgi:hypothetical protein
VTDAPFKGPLQGSKTTSAFQPLFRAYDITDSNGVNVAQSQYSWMRDYIIAAVNAHESLKAENERLQIEIRDVRSELLCDDHADLPTGGNTATLAMLILNGRALERDQLRERVRVLEGALQQHRASVKEAVESANEERLKHQDECEREAEKWKSEGDMYGWNFHMGRAAGMNYMDILWDRVKCAALRASEPKE